MCVYMYIECLHAMHVQCTKQFKIISVQST